jgi:hypothetical protein
MHLDPYSELRLQIREANQLEIRSDPDSDRRPFKHLVLKNSIQF